jgi:hypothetical protein
MKMSKTNTSDTRSQLQVATYDNLGWVKAAYERALNLVRNRLIPTIGKSSLKIARNYTKTWTPETVLTDSQRHEYGLMGLTASLFAEHPTIAIDRILMVDNWEKLDAKVDLQPTETVLQLLNSSEEPWTVSDSNGEGIRLDAVLALYAVQNLMPGVGSTSQLYFDLSISAIKGWLIQETEANWQPGTCEERGDRKHGKTMVRTYIKDGIKRDLSVDALKTLKGWKPLRTLSTYAVKQIGLPVLGSCPVCITRRTVRTENEKEDVPAFPFPKSYLDSHVNEMQIGNPINTGQRVLTGSYIKMWPGSGGKLQTQIRRQCPMCMSVAIRDPATYCSYITEMSTNRGRGPVTPAMVSEWKAEHKELDGNTFRYASGKEVESAIESAEGKEVEAPSTLNESSKTWTTLDLAVRFDDAFPGLLDQFVTFKVKSGGKRVARLKDKVRADQLAESLDLLGAHDLPDETAPVSEESS